MSTASPEIRLVRALAAGILRAASDPAPAAAAHAALREALSTQKSLVLDVQFTGFTRRGEAVGGVDPVVLRAAAQLIMLRVTRVGFTAEAGEAEMETLLSALGRAPAELPPEGVVGLLREAGVRGVYLGTSTGEVYRPPAAEPPPAPAAPAEPQAEPGGEEPPAPPAAPDQGLVLVSDFELLDLPSTRRPALPEGAGAPPAPPPGDPGYEPPADDLFHFFRTASPNAGTGKEADSLVESLRGAQNLNRYDELTRSAAGAVPQLLESGEVLNAVRVLAALVEEARRPDRTRIFRDSATQALRRITTDPVLAQLADLLPAAGEVRERVLRVLPELGGEGIAVLEATLFRTGDAALREAVFRALLEVDPTGRRVLDRAMEDPVVQRARSILELAHLPGLDPALPQRWTERATTHPDPTVRMDAVRHAAQIGGRGGVRILLDTLGDADRLVRRAAIETLGRLGDPAAVPFLARVLNESGDEDLQLEAVTALGRIASHEALPALTAVLQRRQLFSGKRLLRLKTAAIAAVGRIATPAAREVLQSLAEGRDAELAAEARRVLSSGS